MHASLYILLAYLIGSIPVGVLLSRLKGVDPRKTGSGNIGATNVIRAAGKALGILTLLGDIGKGFFPTLFTIYYNEPHLLVVSTGLATFLGHLFPVYLKFKGGKGVATALGVYLAISPLAIIINALIFILVLLKWRYVSVGSLVAAGCMPLTLYLLNIPHPYIYLSFIISGLIYIRHGDNIKRLIKGTERKITFSR